MSEDYFELYKSAKTRVFDLENTLASERRLRKIAEEALIIAINFFDSVYFKERWLRQAEERLIEKKEIEARFYREP